MEHATEAPFRFLAGVRHGEGEGSRKAAVRSDLGLKWPNARRRNKLFRR